jgi:hypothetical protein
MDNKCLAISNKNKQCNNPKKSGNDFCGTHMKMLLLNKSFEKIKIELPIKPVEVKPVEVKPVEVKPVEVKPVEVKPVVLKPNDEKDIRGEWDLIREYIEKDEKIFEKEDIEYIAEKMNYTKDKGKMKDYAKRYMRFNSSKILLIQRAYRRHLARRIYGPTLFNQKLSYNDSELVNCIPINEIPLEYFFSYKDNGKYYTFDVRCLIEIISEAKKDNKEAKNPYSQMPFSKVFYNNFELKKKLIKGFELKFEECELTPEQKFDQEVFDTFKEIDKLGNYTNYRWYTSLDTPGYLNLYRKLRQIWVQYFQGNKKDIVPPDGKVFTNSDEGMKVIKNGKLLRKFILDDVKKLVYSGKTIDDRKMGCWLFLSALVGVSNDAAHAMPHLIGQF